MVKPNRYSRQFRRKNDSEKQKPAEKAISQRGESGPQSAAADR